MPSAALVKPLLLGGGFEHCEEGGNDEDEGGQEKVPDIRTTLRKLVLPVYWPSLMFGLADGVVLPIIPLVARATGASDKVVGIVSSSRAIGKLLADLPAGMFFSNFGSS
eukprot:gene24374-20826_t